MKHLKYKCLLLLMAMLCCVAARGKTHDTAIGNEVSLHNTVWTNHVVEFDTNGSSKIQMGFQANGGQFSNPFLFIDDVQLYQQSSNDKFFSFTYSYNDETLEATVTGLAEGSENVADLVIPEFVEHEGNTYTVTGFNYAGYSEMTSVTVSPSIRTFGKSAFSKASGLQKVIVFDLWSWSNISFYTASANPLYKAKHLFYSDGQTEITELEIPWGLMEISKYAFNYCESLISLLIPPSVASIGNFAFRSCTNLASVDIPEGVMLLGNSAFADCTSLTSVTIPSSVTTIGKDAFRGCSKLREVKMLCDAINSFNNNVFSGAGTAEVPCRLLVPNQYLEHYRQLFADGKFAGGYFTLEGFGEKEEEDTFTNYVEYFLGTDPGLGKATQMAIEADESGAAAFDLPETALRYGLNTIGLRLMTVYADGRVVYSPTTLRTVNRYHSQDAQTVGVEYFVNTDPGVGAAKRVNVTDEEALFDLPLSELAVGVNVLGLRAISRNSETGITYGATQYRYVYRSAATGNRPIERVEYFWDVDPGQGHATPLAFTMMGDSAVVECDIHHDGLYGEHVLSVRTCAGGVWSPLYQQLVILPYLEPLAGLVLLDPDAEENPETGLFQTLQTLMGALATRGFDVGLNIHVADAVYTFYVSEESLILIQTLYNYLLNQNFYLNMKADHSATFNFIMPEEFIYLHQEDLPQIVAAVQAMFSHVLTENISILINGQAYTYDGFQVEPNDLLALKNLYNRLNGPNWTTKKWSFLSNGRDKDELPGVTFNTEGRVTRLELADNNLKGELTSGWSLNLPELVYLNVNENSLSGDLYPFVAELTKLKQILINYNNISEISSPLPESVTYLGAYSQFRKREDKWIAIDTAYANTVKPVLVYMSDKQDVVLPTIFTYNYSKRDYSNRPRISIRNYGTSSTSSSEVASLTANGEDYQFGYSYSWAYNYQQDLPVYLEIDDSNGSSYRYNLTAYPARLRYIEGDANMSGATDVLDVQHTLNKILSAATPFNFSAANTYKDDIINVQDIVCTVNIVLDQELAQSRTDDEVPDMGLARSMDAPEVWLYLENGRLCVVPATAMGAIEIELTGVKTSQVSLLLNHSQFQLMGRNTEHGSRYVIFSPTGQLIPAGEVRSLLKISGQGKILAAQAANAEAQPMQLVIGQQPTGISQVQSAGISASLTDTGLVIESATALSDVDVRLFSIDGKVVMNTRLEQMASGTTTIDVHLTAGMYVAQLTARGGVRKIVKLTKHADK